MAERLDVVFMGTPRFAAVVADAVAARHSVVAVFTRAPKPSGRGNKVEKSPVHVWAAERDIPVFHSFKNGIPKADVGIVAAYGVILKPEVLNAFPRGCVNVHASLLPRWRGAAPVERAIMSGDSETGVTIMQMDAGLDTGPVLAAARAPIAPDDTAETVTERLAAIGAQALLDALENKPDPVPQPAEGATYAAKIEKSEGLLDLSKPAETLVNQIRAIPSWIERNGERIKIIAAHAENGLLVCDVLQRAGKRPLPREEFLRGWHGAL